MIGTIATCATQPGRFEAMTNLEIVLCCVSIIETAVSAYAWRKWKKKLDKERELYETKRIEYERLIEALPIQRNLL